MIKAARRAKDAKTGKDAGMSTTVPLLLLPGTLCNAAVFAPLLAHLALREAIEADIGAFASVAEAAEHVLGTAPPRFALLGFSLGGIIALEIAARAPERIAGLALLCANAHAMPEDQHAARREAIASVTSAGDHVRHALWPSYVGSAKLDDASLRDRIVAMADSCPPGTLGRQTDLALSRIDSQPRLPALAMPVLVLGGEEDVINPPTVQRAMATAIRGAALVLIPGAGHFAPLEAPGACARAVAAWLVRVDDRPFSYDTNSLEES